MSIVKDVRVDTTHTTFFPIINLHDGKIIRIQFDKPNQWKTVDELINFFEVGQNIFINDLSPQDSKKSEAVLNKLFKKFNCWYAAVFTSPDQANIALSKGAERVVYKLDMITKKVIDSIDNDKLVMSFTLDKHRDTHNDEKLFTALKSNGKFIKYLILNLNKDFNSKEVVETTTQIFDLFRKDDQLEDVKMGVNARNIITRTELQLLIGSGVDPHLGYPIHNDLLKLGEIYSLLLNDILQSNYLNLPKNSLPYYPTTVQDIDGNIYQTYYSTKNTLEKTVERRYGVYWSRELHREYKMKEHKIKTIYLSRDKTALLFVIDFDQEENKNKEDSKKQKLQLFNKDYRNPVRRRLDWLTPISGLTVTMGEQIKYHLFDSINNNCWSNVFEDLINLISVNKEESLPKILDKTMITNKIIYPESVYESSYSFYSKIPFNSKEPLTIVTNCEYYAKRWLETSGLKYELIAVTLTDEELINRFDDAENNSIFLATQEESHDVKYNKLKLDMQLYYQFDKSTIIVEENDNRVVKKVDDQYFSLYKKQSYQQLLLFSKLLEKDMKEYPFTISSSPPSEIKVKVNNKGQIMFQRDGVTISDDEADEYFNDVTVIKKYVNNLYKIVDHGFIVDMDYSDLVINYIQDLL